LSEAAILTAVIGTLDYQLSQPCGNILHDPVRP
jgi:hypothetical protein